MGIILKQTLKGTVYSYLGVILGFVISGILFPRYLSTNEVGLINNLIAYSLLLSQIFSLGFNNVTNRMFPYFRKAKNYHNGYPILLISVCGIGILSFISLFPIIRNLVIKYNIENAKLFNQYISFLIPFVLTYLIFSMLDGYIRALYNAAIGIFLREFLQRILILISTILLAINILNFNGFINMYTICILIPVLYLSGYLVFSKQFSIKKSKLNFTLIKSLKKEIISVSAFGIMGGLSVIIVTTIDRIMIAHYAGLDNTGIYSVMVYFGTLVLIPSRSLLKISATVIAEAWKKYNINQIKDVYYKSCLNQFIIGLFIFLILWVNIDNIFFVITNDYLPGKYVIFFLGLTNLIDMATGTNGIIIATSKFFKYQTYFNILLAILTVLTNIIFIPKFGLNGAAIATLISGILFNSTRYLFLYIKFRFQPFRLKYIFVIFLGIIIFFLTRELIILNNFIYDLICKSLFLTASYFSIIYLTKISTEINNVVNKIISIFRKNNEK